MKNKIDLAIMDIESQTSLDFSVQDFEDLQSAVRIAIKSPNYKWEKLFIANLKKLDKKLWKFIKQVRK